MCLNILKKRVPSQLTEYETERVSCLVSFSLSLTWNPLTVLSLLSIHWILFRFLSLEKRRQERVRDTLSVRGTNRRDRDASSSQEQKELFKRL